MTAGPLSGIRVVDVTTVLAGPYCTYQLALLGAEVIKIERPGRGDWVREGPAVRGAPGIGASFAAQNGGKRFLALDLKTPEGLDLALRLIETADVFVENFAPGVAARLGLGYEALVARRPALVYASISGYGQDGPMAPRPAYDHVIQAASGLTMLTGTPDTVPNRVGPPVIDYMTGMWSAFAVLAALRERDRSGRAQRVDVAMLDVALASMASFMSITLNTGIEPKAQGNTAASGSPASGILDTADGKLALAANQEHQVAALLAALQREDLLSDPRFADPDARLRHADAFRGELTRTLATRSAAEWEARLAVHRVPAARVRTLAQTLAEPQVAARDVTATVRDPGSGATVQLPTSGFKLNGSAPAPTTLPRGVGADTDAVLSELGLDGTAIAALRTAGVVG